MLGSMILSLVLAQAAHPLHNHLAKLCALPSHCRRRAAMAPKKASRKRPAAAEVERRSAPRP